MIFRRKPELVDAEVFHGGSEDGWIVYFSGEWFNYERTFETKEQAEEFVSNNDGKLMVETEERLYGICYEDPTAYISIRGKEYRISEGYYIVTHTDGSKYVMHPKYFRDTYEFAGVDEEWEDKLRKIYKEEQ